MKKLLVYSSAIMLMGMASCSNDVEMPEQATEGNVTLTVSIPDGMGTRAFSDGLTANDLEIAVYDVTTETPVLAKTMEQVFSTKDEGKLKTTVRLALANGRSYKIAFFAHKKDGSPYTFDTANRAIKVDYTKMSEYNSTDSYDCFYKLFETGKVEAPINETITLIRPVAQVNWGTSDLAEEVLTPVYGEGCANLVSKVTTKAYTEFSMFDSNVVEGTETDVNLVYKARPNGETFPYEPEKYSYLSMQYLLVPQASSVIDLTFEAAADAAATEPIAKVIATSVPVQANYRTNIFGDLLTNPSSFIVVKNQIFEEPDNNIQLPVKEVSSAADLYYALRDKEGTIVLNEDINYPYAFKVENADMTIDLNGHTLTTKPSIYGDAMQVTNASLVLKNGKIAEAKTAKGDSGMVYVSNNSNVVLDNMTLETNIAIPVWVNGDNSNVTIVSGNYKSTGNSQSIYVSKAAKVVIEGGEFSADYTDKNGNQLFGKYTLNLLDKIIGDNDPKTFIEVKGGTFYNGFNPAESHSENPVANFVAEGYESVMVSEGVYKVVKQ